MAEVRSMSQRFLYLQHEPRSLVSRPRLGLTSESGKGALPIEEEREENSRLPARSKR